MSYPNMSNSMGHYNHNPAGNQRTSGSFILYDLFAQGGHTDSKSPGRPALTKTYSNSTLPVMSTLMPQGQQAPNSRYAGAANNNTLNQISPQPTGLSSRLQNNTILIPLIQSDKIPKRTISIKTEPDRNTLKSSTQSIESNLANPASGSKKSLDSIQVVNENSNPLNLRTSQDKLATSLEFLKKSTNDVACQVETPADQVASELETLKQRLEIVEGERSELSGALDKLKGQIQTLSVEAIRLERSIDKERQEKETLAAENMNMRSELEALSQSIQQMEEENIQLKSSWEQFQAATVEVERELESEKEAGSKLIDELKYVREELDLKAALLQNEQCEATAAKDLLVTIQTENDRRMAEVSLDYEAKFQVLQEEMDNIKKNLKQVKVSSNEQLCQLEAKITALLEEKENLETSLEHANMEKEMAGLELKHVKNLLEETENELRETQKDLFLLHNQLIGDMERTILLQVSLEEKIQLCEIELNQKDSSLERLKSQHDAKVAELTREKEEALERSKGLEGNVATMKEELSKVRKRFSETVGEFENLINDITLELKGRDDMLNERDNELKEMQQALQTSQEDSALAQGRITQLEEEINRLEQKVEILNNVAKESSEEKVQELAQRKKEELKAIVEEFKRVQGTMEEQLEAARKEKIEANMSLVSVQSEKSALSGEVETLRMENDQLSAELSQVNQRMSEQENEHVRKESVLLNEFESSKRELEEKLQNLMKQRQFDEETRVANETTAKLSKEDQIFLCAIGVACQLSIFFPSSGIMILGTLLLLLASTHFFSQGISKYLSREKIGISCLILLLGAIFGVTHQVYCHGIFLCCFDSILQMISSRFEVNDMMAIFTKGVGFIVLSACQQLLLSTQILFKPLLMIMLSYITTHAISLLPEVNKIHWVKKHKLLFDILISFSFLLTPNFYLPTEKSNFPVLFTVFLAVEWVAVNRRRMRKLNDSSFNIKC